MTTMMTMTTMTITRLLVITILVGGSYVAAVHAIVEIVKGVIHFVACGRAVAQFWRALDERIAQHEADARRYNVPSGFYR
jgi:hypothetical protein